MLERAHNTLAWGERPSVLVESGKIGPHEILQRKYEVTHNLLLSCGIKRVLREVQESAGRCELKKGFALGEPQRLSLQLLPWPFLATC